MKLWRFSDPKDFSYARASRRGTWQGTPARRIRPLIVEWEPDSDVIGDFTWPGFDSDAIVTDDVGKTLQRAGVPGFELAPVQMVENSEQLKRHSKKPRVLLPYVGPQLWDLWVTAWTQIDRARSTVKEIQAEDGSESFQVSGVQRTDKIWDQVKGYLITREVPRTEGQGLFIPTTRGIFRISEFPAWIFCTDDVKQVVEAHGFTNVSFLEMGDVLTKET